jgi:hypothetical protein
MKIGRFSVMSALDTTACAPFSKERRIKSAGTTKLHEKSGIWDTPVFVGGAWF